MASQTVDYEETRRRTLEENKKKFQELKLSHLLLSFHEATAPKTPPKMQARRKVLQVESAVMKRRSSRIAALPDQPTYKEEVVPEVVHRNRKFGGRISKHRDLDGRVYASDEAREYAIEKAVELETELGTHYPTFVKPMLQSHTTGGFWLGLPNSFCNKYLPRRDATITLEDEAEDESPTTYLAHKKGLSAGWRGFSINHELVDGDALVFQLVSPTAFKVYIIRQQSYYTS